MDDPPWINVASRDANPRDGPDIHRDGASEESTKVRRERVHKSITALITRRRFSPRRYVAVAINQKSRGRSLDFKCRINHAYSPVRVLRRVAGWNRQRVVGRRKRKRGKKKWIEAEEGSRRFESPEMKLPRGRKLRRWSESTLGSTGLDKTGGPFLNIFREIYEI